SRRHSERSRGCNVAHVVREARCFPFRGATSRVPSRDVSTSLDMTKLSQPTTDPCSEAVKAQRLQSSSTNQLVHLHVQVSAFVGSAKVVVDHDPAAIGKSVAVAIDIATHISVGIKNEQSDRTWTRELAHHCNRIGTERAATYQGNLIEEPKAL